MKRKTTNDKQSKKDTSNTPVSSEQRVLAAMFPFVKEIKDSPISVAIIASAGSAEHAVRAIFDRLIKKGLLVKKYDFTANVYKLTTEAIKLAQQAYAAVHRKKRPNTYGG